MVMVVLLCFLGQYDSTEGSEDVMVVEWGIEIVVEKGIRSESQIV